jgi:general secretion pathway protein F
LNAAYSSSNTAENLATILEPLLIVMMGGAVMLIVLAVLLPIIELNQMVR